MSTAAFNAGGVKGNDLGVYLTAHALASPHSLKDVGEDTTDKLAHTTSHPRSLPIASAKPPEPILRLHHSLIRPLYEDDAENLASQANNLKITKWMRNAFPHPYRVEDATKWISITTSTSPIHDYAICRPEDNTVIGAIGLKPQDDVRYRTMQIGFWLGEEYWGKGIAKEAIVAFSDWTFEQFKHVIRLEAEVYEGNDPSVRVLEKAGYTFEARHRNVVEKMGVVRSVLVYCRFRPGY